MFTGKIYAKATRALMNDAILPIVWWFCTNTGDCRGKYVCIASILETAMESMCVAHLDWRLQWRVGV
jgi:hypothetical protein